MFRPSTFSRRASGYKKTIVATEPRPFHASSLPQNAHSVQQFSFFPYEGQMEVYKMIL